MVHIPSKKRVPQPQRHINSLTHGGFPAHTPVSILEEPLRPGELGRKHFNIPPSQEAAFRPHIRPISVKPSGDFWDTKSGKKFVPEPRLVEVKVAEARHFPEASRRSGHDVPDQGLPWKSKGRGSWGDKAPVPSEFVSTERVLGQECGRKIRVPSQSDRRNGIPMSAPGDKVYACTDYAPGFFKQEGLVPGSCIQQRRQAKGLAAAMGASGVAYDDGVNYRPHPSYELKRRAQMLRDEVESVLELGAPLGGEDSDEEDEGKATSQYTERGEESGANENSQEAHQAA